MKNCLWISLVFTTLSYSEAQRSLLPPVGPTSLRQIVRAYFTIPEGRSSSLNDIRILHFTNSTEPTGTYRLGSVRKILSDPGFDPDKPTVLYAHGYVEFTTDDSVRTIVKAYEQNGGYNILILDWSNIAFGDYTLVSLGVQSAGAEIAKAMVRLVRGGLSREGLHFVGHSMGVHLLGAAARDMAAAGIKVPRLTGLDVAYPGFYPPVLGKAASPADAQFVDMIHTDGGGYGAPHALGHADFWPNGGIAKQPGCVSATIFLTSEDFCSHWRSWGYWAEAVAGSSFWSRQCDDYDAFLRGLCADNPPVRLGPASGTEIRGNFYLRTAATVPYSLGKRGAE
ncbi:pancreatic triacylglycerol lipase-like [Plodia interpunctella]|uniref:pancreatic triacylglycerol lipase-like n=1 Tax=Plodia interpunctella TaxID=58824 RepID=UPI002368A0D3|nr:pancreatic triacylglycerol lipase-like [Plodia interpunctella]